jgi:hypothetical protein
MITFVIGQTLAFDKELERTRLDGHGNLDINLYIEQNVYYLHARMDLKPAVIGLVTLKLYVSKLESDTTGPMSKILAKNLEKRVRYLATQLVRVAGKDYLAIRNKRSIEIIGNLISELFGNPGPEDWKKNNLNILALKNAIERLNENTGIDHADIDLNKNAIEKHNAELKALSAALSKNQDELSAVENELMSLRVFFEISTMIEVLDNLIMALLEVKNDGAKGFCSDRAVDKSFLIENIQGLEANKVGIAPIFGSWQWRQYYRYEMCTLAIEKEALWITLRIPLVKKAENLVRVVPNAKTRFVMSRLAGLGLDVALFREKNNDNFHIMTLTSLDMCNVLGNTRTCGVRDAKFRDGLNLVVPVEFAHNKFLVVGGKGVLKLMERCADKVMERNIEYNSVIAVPDNCSYVSPTISIGRREFDIVAMTMVGLVAIDKFEMRTISSMHLNFTHVEISDVANKSVNAAYERNRKEITESLKEIDTKHENYWNALFFEKWTLVGTLCVLLGLMVTVKACCWYKKRNARHESSAVVFSQGVAKIVKINKETNTGLLKESDVTDTTNGLQIDIPERNFSSPRSNLD